MGANNDHNTFRITKVKEVRTTITPSIEMHGRVIKRHNIVDSQKVSFVVSDTSGLPVDPEENELAIKDNQWWIYKKQGNLLKWTEFSGGNGTVESVDAVNIVEDDDHKFISESTLQVIEQELINGNIPASKIIEEPNKNFMTDNQNDIVNELIDGVIIDGGDVL